MIDYDRPDRNADDCHMYVMAVKGRRRRLSNESESEDDDLGKEGTEVYVATPQEETEVK